MHVKFRVADAPTSRPASCVIDAQVWPNLYDNAHTIALAVKSKVIAYYVDSLSKKVIESSYVCAYKQVELYKVYKRGVLEYICLCNLFIEVQ